MKIVNGLAEALAATFRFHLGETGSEAVLELPLEPVRFRMTRS